MFYRATREVLKQSFYIIVIQIIGILLGAMSVYFVAGDMGPEVYSLVGVHTVVSGIVLTFSHLGVETTMMREALYWIEKGDVEKVTEYTMQSIFSRFIGFFLLFPLVVGYLTFISYTKYDGHYLLLLLSFYVGSCANAINDSMSLIIRSKGDYVFSQFARTINVNVTKFMAIFLYISYGAMAYLYFYCLLPLPLMVVFVLKLRKHIDFSYLKLSDTINKIRDSKDLWVKSYLDYFSQSADNFLITILFPPSVIGMYTLYKNFESICKGFIEGFFDVLAQKCVAYKGNLKILLTMEKKINLARWIVIIFVILLSLVFAANANLFISLANLMKYSQAELIIYCVFVVSILYLIGKNEINLISLFAPSKLVLKFGSQTFLITILSFISVLLIPSIHGVLLQRILIYGATSLMAIAIFSKTKMGFYTQINKQ